MAEGRAADPTSTTTVSVILAVRNGEATLDECIRSLLLLDYPRERVEIIVVDNNSDDQTSLILQNYASEIAVLHEPRQGPAAARNRGIAAASGEVIAITDADCVVHPRWIGNLVSPLDDRTVGVVGGKILARRPCNRVELYGEKIHDHRRAIEEFVPAYAITMNWASRRETISSVGMFDETLLRGSGADMAYRMQEAGYHIVYRDDALVYHRNESTLYGLMDEGFVHGRASVKVLSKERQSGFLSPRRKFSTARRLGRHLWGAVTGANGDRFDELCASLLDIGKAAGEAIGRS